MSTYELSDDLVRDWLDTGSETTRVKLHQALRVQFPVPLPQGLGAVVRAEQGVAIRAEFDSAPWVLHKPQGYEWADDNGLGRVLEVLSPGVEVVKPPPLSEADTGWPPQGN